MIYVSVRTVSEANVRQHWTTRSTRAKKQRQAAWLRTREKYGDTAPLPAIVTISRVAPRELDCDNLRSALKAVRDGVADALGLPNDRDPRVEWRYTQERGKPKEYGVRITIQARNENEPSAKVG